MRISVVIPVLNERENLARLLSALAEQGGAGEIIVVDGGSGDGSAATAKEMGATVLTSARGRGPQLAAGGERATGEVLIFLHADTDFPAGALDAVRQILEANPAAVGGNFRLLFDGQTRFSRWLEGFYARIRARGLYYGDSGIFVRKPVYEGIGGIRPIALMEDYEFTRRLEKAGPTVCIDDPPLVTSSRKFEGRAPVAIVSGWLYLHALYHLGVSPDRLAAIYYGRRRPAGRAGGRPGVPVSQMDRREDRALFEKRTKELS